MSELQMLLLTDKIHSLGHVSGARGYLQTALQSVKACNPLKQAHCLTMLSATML